MKYVQSENEIKVFGIFVRNSYRSMIGRNWDYRFEKFSNCVKSWAPRYLPSLASRVALLKTFALSRVYYVASILPITQTYVKKFESLIRKFIWSSSGWLLKVASDEIKNVP